MAFLGKSRGTGIAQVAQEIASAVDGIDWDPNRLDRAVKEMLRVSQESTLPQLDSALDVFVERLARSKVEDADGVAHVALSGGTLVERGARPEPLALVLQQKLPDVLAAARRFGDCCLAALGPAPEEEEEGEANESTVLTYLDDRPIPRVLFRELLPDDRPGGAALAYLEQWSMPAVAAWTRSRGALEAVVRDERLCRRAAALSRSSASFLDLLLGVQLDATWVALVPLQARGFKLRVDSVVSNFDLHALLAAALVPRGIPGSMNPSQVLAVIRGEADTSGGHVAGSWNLYAPGAAAFDLTQPDRVPQPLWIWNEGRPNDVPMRDGVRVVIVGPPAYERTWGVGRPFRALRARIEVEEELSAPEVGDWLKRLRAEGATK